VTTYIQYEPAVCTFRNVGIFFTTVHDVTSQTKVICQSQVRHTGRRITAQQHRSSISQM